MQKRGSDGASNCTPQRARQEGRGEGGPGEARFVEELKNTSVAEVSLSTSAMGRSVQVKTSRHKLVGPTRVKSARSKSSITSRIFFRTPTASTCLANEMTCDRWAVLPASLLDHSVTECWNWIACLSCFANCWTSLERELQSPKTPYACRPQDVFEDNEATACLHTRGRTRGDQ